MTSSHDKDFQLAVDILVAAAKVVVTTGAGMSKESGIPTFRDAPSALWENYDPQALATPEGFLTDPPLVWRWYAERRRMIAQCSPNPGHAAIAAMETLYDEFLLITQNIDDLHRKAGSTNVIELHGNIFRYKCFDHGHPVVDLPETHEVPPRCPECGSLVRPNVVWYGEVLGEQNLERAFRSTEHCDAMLVVGTSGIVYPAAGFPGAARGAGARVIEINPERTPITPEAHAFVARAAGEALPELLDAVRQGREQL